jgi:hypothetical protein
MANEEGVGGIGKLQKANVFVPLKVDRGGTGRVEPSELGR